MPRGRKHQPKSKIRSTPSRIVSIEIQERLVSAAKGEAEQIIYLGNLVERVMQGEFGEVLHSLLRGRAGMELSESRQNSGLPAERYLGRLDAYDKIKGDLEQYILDKDVALRKLRESQQPVHEKSYAEEPGIEEPSV